MRVYTEWIQSINQSSYPGNCQQPVGSWHVIFTARSTALNMMQAESSPGLAVHGTHHWRERGGGQGQGWAIVCNIATMYCRNYRITWCLEWLQLQIICSNILQLKLWILLAFLVEQKMYSCTQIGIRVWIEVTLVNLINGIMWYWQWLWVVVACMDIFNICRDIQGNSLLRCIDKR